jgi:hypothetical protein
MKLNAKGKAAADKWYGYWDEERAEVEKDSIANYGDIYHGETGWSIIEYRVEDINDEAELMCMVYEDDVFYDLLDLFESDLDDEWMYGMTLRDFLKLLAADYLVMEDQEDIDAVNSL